jgi:Spy/CpxP family protein refolding chaperone
MMFGGGGGMMSQGSILFNMRGFGGGGGGGGTSVRSDVAKELKLTDGQKDKLVAFRDKQMEDMRAAFQGGGGPPDQDTMRDAMKKNQEAETKALKEILDETQQKRLRELWVQRLGGGAYANEEIQKELGFTDDQKAKVKALQDKNMEAMMAMGEKIQSGEIDRSEIRGIIEKNQKLMNEELAKIATKEQAEKLKAMGGAAFKFEDGN